MTTKFRTAKRLVVALAIVLLPTAGCASSQDASGDNDRVSHQLAAIDAAVDLTDAQASSVGEILAKAEADRPSGPPPRGAQTGRTDRRAEMEASRAKTDQLIEATLTKEQVERFREWRATQPERPQGPPPRRQ